MRTATLLDGAEFYGTSRSFTHRPPGLRAWLTCRRSGSTLTGRNYKGIVLRRLKASTYTTQAYRCRCGAHRYIREATRPRPRRTARAGSSASKSTQSARRP